MAGWIGALKSLIDLLSGDSPGAQPFSSFNGATPVQTANYTANFGETVYCNATAGGFTVTLPLITAASKGSTIKLVMRGNPTVGGATPQNVTVAPNALNAIGFTTINTSILLSGHSVMILESDGGTDWIIDQVPACPSTPATLGTGAQTLTRQGPYTLFNAPAVLGATTVWTFSNTGAVAGDIAEIALPTHDGHTLAVNNAAATALATYAATVANGGRFIYTGAAWQAMTAGVSST
jgi:hypothetical protein